MSDKTRIDRSPKRSLNQVAKRYVHNMKLVSFSTKNYRSIKKTPKLELSERTTVLLRAFATAMQVIERLRRPMMSSSTKLHSDGNWFRIPISMYTYDWKKDFPMDMQTKNPDKCSEFILEFELNDAEIADFHSTVGSRLNGTLPIEIHLGRRDALLRVLKQGRGAAALSKKVRQIATFLGRKLDFHYIPAIRTSEHAIEVVEEIVERELRLLESDADYVDAIKRVEAIQSPVLQRISSNLRTTLQTFLQEVKDVNVVLSAERRQRAFRRSTELHVDDGISTNLSAKGDGVQSLAAISLIRHSVTSSAGKRNLVLAIEEPESHIHPGAMHRLKEVLDEIADSQQVLLTTHCPIFVQRKEVKSNLLVEKQKVRCASSMNEIRDSLGVRVQDNLKNSQYVLLVEGEDDRIALESLLRFHSEIIENALDNQTLAIDTMGGGSNLNYKLTELRASMCEVYVLLDHDQAGRSAFQNAADQGLLTISKTTYTQCKGMSNSEFEDWLDESVYEPIIKAKYGEIVSSTHYRIHRDKWSSRVENAFAKLGKPWSKFVEMELKLDVAKEVAKRPENALKTKDKSAFEGMVTALEQMLES
jgi:putative ATP-dependent endonuclease of the OLD family